VLSLLASTTVIDMLVLGYTFQRVWSVLRECNERHDAL